MARREHASLDCKVYVGELGSSGSKEELENAFAYYGPLKEVRHNAIAYLSINLFCFLGLGGSKPAWICVHHV